MPALNYPNFQTELLVASATARGSALARFLILLVGPSWADQVTGASGRKQSRHQLVHAAKIDWFSQVTRDSHIVCGSLKTFGAESSNRYHGYVSELIEFTHPARRSQSVQPWHTDIHQNEVRLSIDSYSDRFLAVSGGNNPVALLLEIQAKHCYAIGRIINHENQKLR
jgi:hypothetical protein